MSTHTVLVQPGSVWATQFRACVCRKRLWGNHLRLWLRNNHVVEWSGSMCGSYVFDHKHSWHKFQKDHLWVGHSVQISQSTSLHIKYLKPARDWCNSHVVAHDWGLCFDQNFWFKHLDSAVEFSLMYGLTHENSDV